MSEDSNNNTNIGENGVNDSGDETLEAQRKEEYIKEYRKLSEKYGYTLDIALTVVKIK